MPSNKKGSKGSWGDFFTYIKSTGFYPATIIDVGVADGTEKIYSTFPRAYLLLIEPIEEFKPSLEKILGKHNGRYILAAAGPSNGSVAIRVFHKKSGSSVLPAIACETGNDHRDRIVPMIALDDVAGDLEQPILLKLDIQGAELLALDGASNTLANCDLVVLETSMFSFQPNMPAFYDVVHYMKRNGFVVYEILGGSYRPFDDALGQVDLVFVKEDGRFRSSNAWS